MSTRGWENNARRGRTTWRPLSSTDSGQESRQEPVITPGQSAAAAAQPSVIISDPSSISVVSQIHPRISLTDDVSSYYYNYGRFICGYIAALASILNLKANLDELRRATFNVFLEENAQLHFDKPIKKLVEYFFLILKRDRSLYYGDDIQTLLRNCYLSSITYVASEKKGSIREKMSTILKSPERFYQFTRESEEAHLEALDDREQREKRIENFAVRERTEKNPDKAEEYNEEYERILQQIEQKYLQERRNVARFYRDIGKQMIETVERRRQAAFDKKSADDSKSYEIIEEAEEYRFYTLYGLIEMKNRETVFLQDIEKSWQQQMDELNDYQRQRVDELENSLANLREQVTEAEKAARDASFTQKSADDEMRIAQNRMKEARKMMAEAAALKREAKDKIAGKEPTPAPVAKPKAAAAKGKGLSVKAAQAAEFVPRRK